MAINKPVVGGDQDAWGEKLNQALDQIAADQTATLGLASSASTNASSALTKANTAVADAALARQSASDTALAQLEIQNTAQAAKTASDWAVATASTAKATADSAQNTANNAATTASTALTAANSALQATEDFTGPAGADGASAYDVAVAQGFVGTEEEWLASLQGEPGPAGAGAGALTAGPLVEEPGWPNTATGDDSVVTGGAGNSAEGTKSFIGGGEGHTASGWESSVLGGNFNTASGDYSAALGGYGSSADEHCAVVFGGESSHAAAQFSQASGVQANATFMFERQHASGANCIERRVLLKNATSTTATTSPLTLDGSAVYDATAAAIVPAGTKWVFEAYVVGGGLTSQKAAGYRIRGVIKRPGAEATTVFVGTPVIEILGEDDTTWDVVVEADTTLGSLKFTVTGATDEWVRWAATVNIIQTA